MSIGCPKPPLVPLTPRQLEVLELIAMGYTPTQAAERMHLSLHTVKSHLLALRAQGDWETTEQACAWFGYSLGQTGVKFI